MGMKIIIQMAVVHLIFFSLTNLSHSSYISDSKSKSGSYQEVLNSWIKLHRISIPVRTGESAQVEEDSIYLAFAT